MGTIARKANLQSLTNTMDNNRELLALLNLIDDPDHEVFVTVNDKLLSYGSPVIPLLENFWETTPSEEAQERIEMIIHSIHFKDLTKEFELWKKGGAELLYGSLLVAKYQYPELQTIDALQELERIRRNIWLEMNSYMTPLEQTRVMESILYNFYKLRGGEIAYNKPNEFMIQKVIESKKGNSITNGILYLLLSELLDLPIKAVSLPQQFVLGWFAPKAQLHQSASELNIEEHIQFYIDPNSGVAFSSKDVHQYLNRNNFTPTPSYFKPMSNIHIIQFLLKQLSHCFTEPSQLYKQAELEQLVQLLGKKH